MAPCAIGAVVLEGERALVMPTSVPAVAVTLTVAVLLAASPSGKVEATLNAAVTVPATLALAVTLMLENAAPVAARPSLRVHETVPLAKG